MTEIDRRLRELRSELDGLSWRERRRVLAEARDHLLSSLEDGCDERQAVGRLGPGAAFAGFPARRRRHVVLGVGVAVPLLLAGLALAPSLDVGLRTRGLTPAQAKPKPTLTAASHRANTRRCVAVWNAPANRRFWALARQQRATRALVNPSYGGKVTKVHGHLHFGPMHFAGCGVNLWLEPDASPFQRYVFVGAAIGPHGLRFTTVHRGRARTAARSANSHVLASGRLAYAGHQLPGESYCGGRTAGTAVVGVEALPAGVALSPTGTTSVPATPRPRFVMTVRNVGTVAVHGAILSLEVGGPSRPRRPWFRTRPHVVALLQPGETATLVVAPPPLGHGPRYVRANSAAVGCESRVADNSRVFSLVLR